MNVVTIAQVNKAQKDLEAFAKEAKKRLFEFETVASLYEFQQGKVLKFKNVKSLMRSLKK